MKQYLSYSKIIFYLLLLGSLVFSQDNQKVKFFDGPHIIYNQDSLIINYYSDGTAHTFYVKMEDTTSFLGFLQDSNELYTIPKHFDQVPEDYPKVGKFFIVSDIHGQYEIFRKLLYNSEVIDQNNSWIWDNGHLVIIGDLFDKGTKIHESLWLIYNLEQQARAVGGTVHFILGNHEVKALRGDLKYVRENYFILADVLSITIPELYYDNTFWGRWLRSKNVLTKIGDLLFVHGGIHPEIIEKYTSISEINCTMKENIDLSLEEIKMDPELAFLFRKDGPIRYRGFFQPDSLPEVSNQQLNAILDHFDIEKIIVGHTSGEHIYTSHQNKIICVDSRIMNGLYGEGLLILNGKYYIVNTLGIREQIIN